MKNFTFVIYVFFIAFHAKAEVVINELMQSNIDCVVDDLNNFPDSWVELYNSGTDDVNLATYSIGITSDHTTAWKFPSIILKSGQYLLVYCDKEKLNRSLGIHTDFRLESGKNGALYLFKGSDIIDKLEGMSKQPAPNIAYGRTSDGAEEWGYMLNPTPGATNAGGVGTNVLGAPSFSRLGCVMTEGDVVTLTLSLPDNAPEGTQIYYTTDGSEPTTGSDVFQGALTISTNTVVKAKLFCEGYLPAMSTTQSYIFFPADRDLTLSVVSLSMDPEYLYDDKFGIYVDGTYSSTSPNYRFDWRRPVNIEYFNGSNKKSVINQLGETRIGGSKTREKPLKTMILYANKRFGTKRLSYELFPDQRPGKTDFKSVLLRNAGNDFHLLYMRDALIQAHMAANTDLDYQAWNPTIVYVNGQYMGILNMRERANESNIYTNYNGLEDIDLIENWAGIKEGTADNLKAFTAFYSEKGHTMEEYEQWMDCEEFTNLMIMELYFNNVDFPGNNIMMWRPRADGGRWRWIAKDVDFGLNLIHEFDINTIEWFYDENYELPLEFSKQNGSKYTLLFRNMTEDETYRRYFTDRCAIYMGDFLNINGLHEVWDPMYEMVKTEMPVHRALQNFKYEYSGEMGRVHKWMAKHTNVFYKYVTDFYNLGTPQALKILYTNNAGDVNIMFNGVRLSGKRDFDGYYYQDSDVTLEGTNPDGSDIEGWTLTTEDEFGDIQTQTVLGGICTFTMPQCKQLSITPLTELPTGIIEVSQNDADATTDDEWFTISGQRLSERPAVGGIYIHNGKKVMLK